MSLDKRQRRRKLRKSGPGRKPLPVPKTNPPDQEKKDEDKK